LSSLVRDEEIGIVARELPPPEACRLLVDLANLRGGPDNITVVIARVGPMPTDLPTGEYDVRAAGGEGHLGWIWPIVLLLAGVAFIAGHLMTRAEYPLAGFLVQALGIVAMGSLLLASVRARKTADRSGLPRTTPGTPYRTASARTTPAFVTELANIEYNLQRSAIEEGWSIEWGQHSRVFQSGKEALAEQRYSDALRDFAKAIHILIAGIHLLRKQRDQAARWGARPPAAREESEPSGK
jgi:protein phosphatase